VSAATGIAVALLLGVAVCGGWLAAIAFLRLETPIERLHAVTFVNVAVGGMVMLAACLSDGFSPRAIKCVGIWLVAMLGGALLSFRTARALHLRGGERR